VQLGGPLIGGEQAHGIGRRGRDLRALARDAMGGGAAELATCRGATRGAAAFPRETRLPKDTPLHHVFRMRQISLLAIIGLAGTPLLASAQSQPPDPRPNAPQEMPVNWLYGAYVPKDVPLVPLALAERRRLWARQTLLTPGIYFKTGLFALGDQIADRPAEWHGGVEGFGQRFASRYGQFAIQTSLTAAANAAIGYEPRYERCRCSGVWPRARHALFRNFVTYDRSERKRRPQIAMYAGAWGAGLVASTWKPAKDDVWKEGYSSLATQAAFGSLANLLGEFAEDIARLLGRRPPS